ncbi:MAG: hypothetical protein AAF928_09745 [Myxococcota bacterium]
MTAERPRGASAAERARIRDQLDRMGARGLQLTSLIAAVAVVLAWVVGRILLYGTPEDGPGRRLMPILLLVALVSWALMKFTPLQRRPGSVATVGLAAMAFVGGLHLGQLGGVEGPFFYAVYTIPPVLIVLPVSLRLRIAGTVGGVASFVGAYAINQPDFYTMTMFHIPIVYMTGISFAAVVIGHRVYRLQIDKLLALAELEARNDRLGVLLDQ